MAKSAKRQRESDDDAEDFSDLENDSSLEVWGKGRASTKEDMSEDDNEGNDDDEDEDSVDKQNEIQRDAEMADLEKEYMDLKNQEQYNVHEKMVNFCARQHEGAPDMASKLFENLFGVRS
ncbi:hypothetical protein ACFE04_017265 [Oxalis oulophora]